MSKMFDALRRAEAERRRKAESEAPETQPDVVRSNRAAPSPQPTQQRTGPVLAPSARESGVRALPDDFVRELGILRNSIDTALRGRQKRSIMFTSSAHEEGTTTLALNFAAVVASQGHGRVLLVEVNARRPSLYWRLGLSANDGVTDYFESNRTLASVVQPVEMLGIDVIHIGQRDPAKIQLHLEKSFPELIQEALRTYDTVVVDAPPTVLSPETPPMTASVDGVVLVVQCERTKREIVQRSLGMIAQFQGKVLGTVLNRKKYYIPEFIYRRL